MLKTIRHKNDYKLYSTVNKKLYIATCCETNVVYIGNRGVSLLPTPRNLRITSFTAINL